MTDDFAQEFAAMLGIDPGQEPDPEPQPEPDAPPDVEPPASDPEPIDVAVLRGHAAKHERDRQFIEQLHQLPPDEAA